MDYASAATIRDTCVKWAQARGMKMTLVVLDARAMPVTLAHMDGVSMAGGEIAQWKANAAAKFGRATADFAATPPPPGVPNVAAMQGGVPIYTTAGVLLGGVGVSGGKPTDDAACAAAGIEAAGLTPARPVQPAQ
ncbi:hypothetical protein BFL28_06290 [Sphingomonas turrisvirgatae]|uniref:GlcG protein n=1 Tax=Sphingomonas turrisvirgatae TaxID=1888892 RepID=A0A1E3LRJ7_9SPHN|nr:hypothetical protein BFL28_06290 [Sphingomonas turrisvirgatae]